MSNFARIPHVVKRVVPILLLVVVVFHLAHSGSLSTDKVVTKLRNKKTVFLEQFLKDDIGPALNGAGIGKICSQKSRNEKLVFNCDTAKEGIASVRQHQLHCIRLGIESGAAKLVLPHVVKRIDRDFRLRRRAKAPSNGVPLNYMFDFDHLRETLEAHCPHVEVYSSMSDLHDIPSILDPIEVSATDVYNHTDYLTADGVLAHPEEWETKLWQYIDGRSPEKSRHYPLRVLLMDESPTFPVYKDGVATAREIGSLLRIRPDARRLAGAALFALSQRFNLDVHLQSRPDERSFVGVHLRIEKDSKKKFPDYVSQAAAAFDFIVNAKAKVVFLATGGSQADIDRFTARAKDFGVTVVTKASLLEGAELAQLRDMSYDQQALVDYEIMKRAGRIVGRSQSRFSWDLAIARAAAYGDKAVTEVPETDGSADWEDHFTTLLGGMNSSRGAVLQSTWP